MVTLSPHTQDILSGLLLTSSLASTATGSIKVWLLLSAPPTPLSLLCFSFAFQRASQEPPDSASVPGYRVLGKRERKRKFGLPSAELAWVS